MEMPTPCDCGEVVELNDMRTCNHCNKMLCKGCFDYYGDDYCTECKSQLSECVECGDMVETEKLEKKGRCYMCNETMV